MCESNNRMFFDLACQSVHDYNVYKQNQIQNDDDFLDIY